MGAGVAASPHCPVAAEYQAWEARQSAGRFRGMRSGPGAWTASSGFLSEPKLLQGFPAGSPTGPKPWRFAARQFRNRGSVSRHRRAVAEARFRLRQDSFGRSLSPAWQPLDFRLRPAVSQLPGRNPVLPDAVGTEVPSAPVAARRLASRFLPDRRRTEIRCLPFRSRTRGFDTLGALRSLPLTHPLKASPQLPHGGGFVSRPGLRFTASIAWWDKRRLGSGCGWEGFRPLPVDRLGHGLKLS